MARLKPPFERVEGAEAVPPDRAAAYVDGSLITGLPLEHANTGHALR